MKIRQLKDSGTLLEENVKMYYEMQRDQFLKIFFDIDEKMEWVNEGYLHDGAWWIPKDIFFDLMKRGFGKKIQYAFVIEGQARLMPIDKLITMAKSRGFVERSSSEDMGIPIPLFQTL